VNAFSFAHRAVRRNCVALALAGAVLSGAAAADRIHLTDGTVLSDVDVSNETLEGVVYRAKGKASDQTAKADQVMRVEYEKMPKLIDTAESEAADGNLEVAAFNFVEFVDTLGDNKRDKQAWAPAYALYRAMQTNLAMSSKESTEKAVALGNRLVAEAAESRYVPLALLLKASAQRDLGKPKDAVETIGNLRELVQTRSLSDMFRLEADLLEVEMSDLKGQARRDKLVEIQGQAGTQFPLVKNRARVLEAETYFEGEQRDYAKARKIYEGVIKDPKADRTTLAGAYTGMGDCLFEEAVDASRGGADASKTLEDAAINYLRVAIVYEEQTRYVPKAMFQAGKSFDLMANDIAKSQARKMYGTVISRYPGSEWAEQARSARR
jgi:hypothetical protein